MTKKSSNIDSTEPQPMDATITEATTGTAHVNHQRQCYAMETLIKEVLDLFPDTPFEVSNFDGRNTGHDVTFDATAVPEDERTTFNNLLLLTETDIRVKTVTVADDEVLVEFTNDPRFQDMRLTFGLTSAYMILVDTEGQQEPVANHFTGEESA